jgi:uncharacterized protein (TIGR00369 family)
MRQRKLSIRETRNILNKTPFNKLLGMKIARLHRDGITIECKIDGRLLNSAGVLHGGVSAALADAAAGLAIHQRMGGHSHIATVEMKINYFRPVTKGRVHARSHLLRVGSTRCVGRVDITDEKARAVGTALVTYILLGARELAAD